MRNVVNSLHGLHPPWGDADIIKLAVSAAPVKRAGRIGNRVQITDGTAAVNTDGQIMAKASHWGNLRRLICSAGVFSGTCESEDLLWEFIHRVLARCIRALWEKRQWRWHIVPLPLFFVWRSL